MNPRDSIFLPKGFQFSAVTAGIKASGKPDLAAILCGAETRGAALFTQNCVVAAPVEVGRAALASTRGRVRAVLVNSGNANCATGKAGIRDCKSVCAQAARLLKVHASELAVATMMSAMQACGLSGYRNDSEFSLGRHLRDILSSPIMISNDRILANIGAASLLGGVPSSLRD